MSTTTISLQKSQAISLTKESPSVSKFYIACGWGEQQGVDIDVSAFACRIESDGSPYLFAGPDPYSYLCFYNNTVIPGRGIVHSGDNRCGKNNPAARGTPAEFDDEAITVDINALPPEVDEIAVILTIDQAAAKRQSFGTVRECFIRIAENGPDGREIASYKPTEDFRDYTAVMIGSLMKRNGGWEFEAVGQGYVASFEQVVGQFVK
jgi:tellurium resistance protein TerD